MKLKPTSDYTSREIRKQVSLSLGIKLEEGISEAEVSKQMVKENAKSSVVWACVAWAV